MFSKIMIGTTGDYSPFSTRGANGGYYGFDIDLLDLILPEDKTYVQVSWQEITNKLISSAIDCIASGITVTPNRQENALFSRPYLLNQTVVVAARRDVSRSIEKLGVNRGGYLESIAHSKFPNQQIITVHQNQKLPTALLAGEFDAFLSDALEAQRWCTQFGFCIIQELEKQAQAIMLRKDLHALKTHLDTRLTQLILSGGLQQLAAKYDISSDYIPT